MAVPPELAGHLNLDSPPVTPRPSATVLLVRAGEPWELLMVHRPGGADFAPGAYVFPGGTVHEDDHVFDDEIRAAAVRELFEEVGILLAPGAEDAECEKVREVVKAGASFGDALRQIGLTPAFDQLVLFARWVTPALLRRRFDARFYLARMPGGQSVRPQEGEVTDWVWISPRRALSNSDITLVYATRAVLESVVDAPDVATLFTRARGLKEIPTVEPRLVETDHGWEIVRD
jgi:8-oxo-dGTP pyrophosphatase MutT (NUDIX family)